MGQAEAFGWNDFPEATEGWNVPGTYSPVGNYPNDPERRPITTQDESGLPGTQGFWTDTIRKREFPPVYDFVPEGGYNGSTRGWVTPDMYRQPQEQPYIYKMPSVPRTRDMMPNYSVHPDDLDALPSPQPRQFDPSVISPDSPRAIPRQSSPPIGLDYTQWEHFPEVG